MLLSGRVRELLLVEWEWQIILGTTHRKYIIQLSINMNAKSLRTNDAANTAINLQLEKKKKELKVESKMSLLSLENVLKFKRLERIGSFKRRRNSCLQHTETDSSGSVLKNLSFNTGQVGLIPSQGTKSPRVNRQLSSTL